MSTTYDDIIIKSDSKKLILGAAGAATDAYIYFDGSDMTFYDSTLGSTATLSELAAAGSPTLDSVFENGKLIDGSTATGADNAFSVGGAAADDKVEIYHTGTEAHINARADDLYITAAGGDINFGDDNLTTTGTINVGADNTNLTLGASGATDSRIFFDGSGNLSFYDSNHGATITLSDMAGSNLNTPTVTGDMTISDGKIVWTDSTDEVVLAITADANTTSDVFTISADGLTTGAIAKFSATEGTLNGGHYMVFYDETAGANVLSFGEDGLTTITGAAGSDMLVITAGNLQMTNGDIDMDEGKIEINSTTDETSYVKRNAAGSAAVVEIEQTHVGSTGSALLIDQNATGNAKGIEISHDGDYAALDISAGAARTGNVINIPMANQLAETALDITGAATGTASEGIIHVDVTGALAGNALRIDSTGANAATGQLIYALSSGNQAAATNGICGYFADTGAAQATSYAVYISSTNNEALHVDSGTVVIDESLTIGVNSTGGAGFLELWDGAGGNTPAYIKIASPNGTVWYLFVEDDGTLKAHNDVPTQNSDGSAVGDQTD